MGWYPRSLKRRLDSVGHASSDRLVAPTPSRGRKARRRGRPGSILDAGPATNGVESPLAAPSSEADHPAGPGAKIRPHVGYDIERAAWAARKPDLLTSAPGEFVVFVGEEMAGPFPDFRSALRAGYRRFGEGPLSIKQILAEEPVVSP